ncbi:hypothetical protein [Kyrpidia sp.]|uniref:hypothetical protein n=1 Tax=Kyrpidia sp. TaxID=2073077 RepID=UPI00258F63CB|nr:hypothetical protein [Kyrpidia sp.]MCL6577432.1 hypothetical protein [Kyrpidia sp.]
MRLKAWAAWLIAWSKATAGVNGTGERGVTALTGLAKPLLSLAGINVVSLEQAGSSSFATCQLAELAARCRQIGMSKTGGFACAYDSVVLG